VRMQPKQPKPPFEKRLAQEAQLIKELAKSLPRELLSRKARQLETASHLTEWLSSPGLMPPK